MRIIYSSHAEEQLKERDISKQQINIILNQPQQVLAAKKGRKIAQSIVKLERIEFLVRIIYIEKMDCYEVVTVYKTTKIKKYWREKNENSI